MYFRYGFQILLLTLLAAGSNLSQAHLGAGQTLNSEPMIPQQIKQNLADLARLEELGNIYVDQFERELDQAGASFHLHSSEPYQNLLSIRKLAENRRSELEDLVAHLPWTPSQKRKLLEKPSQLIHLASDDRRIQMQIEALKAERHIFSNPPGAKIFPDPHQPGNLTGSEFPPEAWAMTFDDGPHPQVTEKILDILDRQKIKATFFWLAKNVLRYPKLVERAGDQGHALENHSFSHPQLSRVSGQTLRQEVSESTKIMERSYKQRPRFFRCPFGDGVHNDRVRNAIAKENMIHVFWNVDSLDWKIKDPARVKKLVLAQMSRQRAGIVLFHDIKNRTPEVVNSVLTLHRNKRWVTLPEIVDELNK